MTKILRKNRHFRWNWRQSIDDPEKIDYYFVIVDDKNRKAKIEEIINKVNSGAINFSFEEISLPLQGKVGGTSLKYLCKIYESKCGVNLVNEVILKIFKDSVIKDNNLYDRVKTGTSLELYLAKLYEK